MASTSLFAPQVRAVQPAFIYPGGVKIYFSFSSFNNPEDITLIRYSLIDPNQASTWGNNSMLEGSSYDSETGAYYKTTSSWTYDSTADEYYISLNSSNFKTLTTNQFYQMQLWAVDSSGVSAPSQTTLIRPILTPTIIIVGNGQSAYELEYLRGEIIYPNNNTAEALDTCYCTIGNYTSSVIKCTGLDFAIPLNYNFIEGTAYSGIFYYTTINGYSGQQSFSITLTKPGTSQYSAITIGSDLAAAAIKLTYSAAIGAKIQRTSEESNFQSWKTIHTLTTVSGIWRDYTIESNVQYKYRILNSSLSNGTPITAAVKVDFEDITLSDENAMIIVRYNPNISGFKYITQESITNTLGGKYPIIRRNGDTRYRQFNLSGLIYVDCTEYDTYKTAKASNKLNMSDFLMEDTSSLYIVNADIVGTNQHILEKRARLYVMDFLSNGKVKLFRSFEEGNMIVYLSAVSFTPNKQLDRHIYDFSATVTEVCEYNPTNLKKYGLDKGGYIEFMQAVDLSSDRDSVTEWEG